LDKEKGEEGMSFKKKAAGLFILTLAGVAFLAVQFSAQEACTEFPTSFSEPFDNTTYRDAARSSVNHWGDGYITLNPVGAQFIPQTSLAGIPAWANIMTAGDFDKDGWTDLVVSGTDYSGGLLLLKNTAGVFTASTWLSGGPGPTPPADAGFGALTSGDYDGDNDIDLFFVVSNATAPYAVKRVWFFQNDGGSPPTFTKIDMTASWGGTLAGIAWPSTCLKTADFDKDTDPDIFMGNKNGQVLLIRNNGKTRKIDANNKWNDVPSRTPLLIASINPGWSGRGVSAIALADFDNDTDMDMILGSVSYGELKYYKNDGTGVFSLYQTISDPTGDTTNDSYDGGATVMLPSDFDKDGDVDFVVGTDDYNYKPGADGIGGEAYYFLNSKGDFISTLIFDSRMASPPVTDFDTGVSLDYDHDANTTTDIILTGGHNSGKLSQYPFKTTVNPDYFNLQGTAQSANITPLLDPNLHAITRVRIKSLNQRVNGTSTGLAVVFYVSNNDGRNWELYRQFDGADIRSYTDLAWHTFEHYGGRLRWKAVLTAPDDGISGIPNASRDTPQIESVDFDIIHIERREYSRTSVAATVVDDSGLRVELTIGGTFYYPGWQGHLIAYDVTNMGALNTTYSELRTVSSSNLPSGPGRTLAAGVTIRWDAGSLLETRAASSRVIYTALPNGSSGFNREDFSTGNIDALDDYLQDTEGENAGLIDFVRGVGRDWKLGDINHSNPAVVGPPRGSAALMGEGYQEFRDALANRRTVLYVGANDGLLHCFDVLTGEELWGFVPFNLLPKLKNMWAVDPDTQERYFNRDVFVDGSPTISDVYINGEWKTILLCGQGPGQGSVAGGGLNYYFALDVTNPENPIPLWELTATTMGESWSVPAIGKVTKGGQPTWAAFLGSGYDNDPDPGVVLGNVFYAVDLADGSIFWTFTADDVDTSDSGRLSAQFTNIQNTMPGSPALIDTDRDGFAEKVYIGDLDGRLWGVDISSGFQAADSWSASRLYVDPDNYPIITKPAVWRSSTTQLPDTRVYFGTGGDDAAPNLAMYSFIALIDRDTGPEVEWYVGAPDAAGIRAEDKDVGDLAIAEKVWADPKIADYTVYFSTLTGSIESVDPCANLGGVGKLYGRFIISFSGSAIGGSAFKTATGPMESLDLSIKTRSAVTIGEQQSTETGLRKREVYIQEYNSTVQKLEQTTGGLIRITSWREIYKIIKK
jgi:PilY1 beta-propeller domain/FG-GAP-like repeat